MTRGTFRRLYRHMEWADSLVWDEVLRHEGTVGDPFVRESMFHLHVVQRAYLTGWTGGTPQRTQVDDFPSLASMCAWAQTYYPDVGLFLDALEEDELTKKGDVLWPELIERAIGRQPVPITLADMVYQVAAHSTHHRAQVNRRIRELDGAPPFIDYVAWAWAGEPPPSWG